MLHIIRWCNKYLINVPYSILIQLIFINDNINTHLYHLILTIDATMHQTHNNKIAFFGKTHKNKYLPLLLN